MWYHVHHGTTWSNPPSLPSLVSVNTDDKLYKWEWRRPPVVHPPSLRGAMELPDPRRKIPETYGCLWERGTEYHSNRWWYMMFLSIAAVSSSHCNHSCCDTWTSSPLWLPVSTQYDPSCKPVFKSARIVNWLRLGDVIMHSCWQATGRGKLRWGTAMHWQYVG